jgi:hypothetical protein
MNFARSLILITTLLVSGFSGVAQTVTGTATGPDARGVIGKATGAATDNTIGV